MTNWPARFIRFLRKEFVAAWPVFLFFLIGFSLLILLVKLVVAKFSVEVSVISNALIGALIAAKAVLILDETPLARFLEGYRRIIAITVKTILYGAAGLSLGYLERIFEAFHRVHTSRGAFEYVIEHANHYLLLGWALGIGIIFGLYFSFFEISRRMGSGELAGLFFGPPEIAGGTERPSQLRAGESNK